MKSRTGLIFASFLLFVAVIVTTFLLSPQTSPLIFQQNQNSPPHCLHDDSGDCLMMPGVTGFTINSEEISFPHAFEEEYHLVVMPFDRDQQVLATAWLPLFEELVAEHESLDLWSIAPLPSLNPGVRLLVTGGISVAITDASLRPQIAILFLEDQQTFLDALAIETPDSIQVFILDKQGRAYYRDSGEFSDEKAQQLANTLIQLMQN